MSLTMEQLMYLIDRTSRSLISIDDQHSRVHEGDAYVVSKSSMTGEFDKDEYLTIYFISPNSDIRIHLTPIFVAGSFAWYDLHEDDDDPTHFSVSGGSQVIPINRDRNSTKQSSLTVYTGVTISAMTDDSLLITRRMGQFLPPASDYGRLEFILKRDTAYLARITSDANTNYGSLRLEYYETPFR